MSRLTPPPVHDRRALEGDGWTPPVREFRPAAEQSAAVEVRLTRLAGSDRLGDPHDHGGDAVFELVGADGALHPFPQFLAFHRSAGLEFSYGGSGPFAAAVCVLGLVLPPREAYRLASDYRWAVIAPMPRDGGTIRLADLRAWVELRWADERADAALMADEAERRLDIAELARLEVLERGALDVDG